MSTYAYHAIQSESASRLQVGRYSLRVAEGSEGRALLIVSNGIIEQTFDLSSFIVTPFDPSGTLVPYPYPGDSGVIIDTTTLYEAMRLMAEFIIGFHNSSETSFSSLSSLAVTGTLSGPTITSLTTRVTNEETKSTFLRTDVDAITLRVTDEETKSTTLRTDVDAITLRVTDEETKSTSLRTDVDAITSRVTHNESISTTLRTDVDAITLRVTDEETKSTTLRTDVNSLTSRMGTAEGTLASHSSLISSASTSAAAVNARVTRIMGTYYYPNGYDDPNNSDFRTLEWVVDYMLRNIIPTLGELEGSNTLQSWLLGVFGAASFAEAIVDAAVIKTINATLAVHGTQLAAHAMSIEANLLTMSGMEVDITALKASVSLTAGQVLGLMILGGSIGTGLYLMINRKNGPMTYTEVPPSGQPKYSPVVNDTDPVALIGYTDPIARIINDVSYEVADARLIKFEGSDARIDPTLRVDTIIVSTINGVYPSEYALASSLANYVPNSVLNNYAPKTSVTLLMNWVDDIETITNRFAYEDGTTNLHFEYESTFDIDVGDYVPMSFRNDGSVTIDKLLVGTGIYGAVTIKDWSGSSVYATINEDGLTVSKINGVDPFEYALVSSLSDYATVSSLSNYALVSSLSNYATVSSLSSYALTSSLSNYATTSSLSTLAGRVTTVETKTTSLSYTSSATTISNALRLPGGMSIDPTNSIVYYGTNVRIEKWWVAPWGAHVNDALILLDHVNTSAYGNEVRMLDGRLNLFRHPGAWSHGVYIDVHFIHFGIETVPQIANINYVSYNTDGTEPHAREPRLALVTHTASSKQYLNQYRISTSGGQKILRK